MNGTPRLRSAFPSTPRHSPAKRDARPASNGAPAPPKFQSPVGGSKSLDGPLIPLSVIDAPSQRFYVVAFYIALTAWRLFDYSQLVSDETDSPWQWMKWTMIDGVVLSAIPSLRIPWLEWSTSSVTVLFLIHAVVNGVLMFRIPIPLEAWIMALTRMLYDRELAVSERRVKPGSLLDHASLISGRQIIHILPEGSAMLNPHHAPFCIDKSRPSATIPLFMNQTNPVSIELLRIDLDTNENETIEISAKEARKMKRNADREFHKKDTTSPRVLEYQVKKTGIYRLLKVVDESNLEVQRVRSDALVVPCPHGGVKPVPQNKCRGELSDFYFQVEATPPLRIKYRKTVNDEDSSDVQLTVHPENLDSPLSRRASDAVVRYDSASSNLEWARPQIVEIPVNETLGLGGSWYYFLEEIRDGCGNVVNYTKHDSSSQKGSDGTLGQEFRVRERPRAIFRGCSPQSPLKVAKGQPAQLPVWINPTGHHDTAGQTHHISYSFAPQLDEGNGESSEALLKTEKTSMGYQDKGPQVTEPGLYTLESVATDYCSGEIFEPASCLISNPPEPDLSVDSDAIPHQCAGNSIGLHLDLDLIGSPPFQVSYTVQRRGERAVPKLERINGMRTQLEFKPQEAGYYKYEFLDIADEVYKRPLSLKHKELTFTQDVKPTAWARFQGDRNKRACIGDTVSFNLHLSGDEPWSLDYDIVHQGKRRKHSAKDITSNEFELKTPPLNKGGQHVVSLASITDKSGCKISLDQEANVEVRHQRPSAAFGQIEGKNSALTLQGKKVHIPVRMAGERPWDVQFTRSAKSDPSKKVVMVKTVNEENDFVEADSEGIYELESVSDRSCPGTVEAKSNSFEVSWIARPSVHVVEGQIAEQRGGSQVRAPVCVGDQDAVEVSFSGSPPYHLKYDVKKSSRGASSTSTRTETIGLGAASIAMDTAHAGSYEYSITELGDQLYDHDRQGFSPMTIQQHVHPLPSADFVNAGKTYSYCKEQALKEETIPISLSGTAPFSLEVAIRHHATTKPEIVTIPRISSTKYEFQIPQRALSLGSHVVTIRKVGDANGCQRLTDVDGPSARVNVVDVPSISPLELATDFCVGDRISYTLAGTPPFSVFYTFEGQERKASTSTNSFRRLAERPGNFTITAISDRASTDSCRARVDFTKTIHELPSVRISKGRTAEVDIHEGGDAEIVFEFGGTPPFEFTYTRSTNSARGKAAKILETKTEVSDEHSKPIRVSEEGTYEVVAVRDRFCSVSTQKKSGKGMAQRALTFG